MSGTPELVAATSSEQGASDVVVLLKASRGTASGYTARERRVKIGTLQAALSRVEKRKKAIEGQIREQHTKQLIGLPRKAGLADIDSLVIALLPFVSSALRKQLNAGGFLDSLAAGAQNPAHNRGLKFPDDVRTLVQAELAAGLKSITELSQQYGPSRRTIMNWKRELGMTRPRHAEARIDPSKS